MNKKYIQKIEKKIIQLLLDDEQSLVGVLLEDCCSELSRLVASWIKEDDQSSRLLILKGVNVCNTKKSHDILAVITLDGIVYVVDSTVWQFFPERQTILLFTSNDLDEALEKVEKMYGGKWQVSEKVTQVSSVDQKKYLDIILRNIQENLRQNKDI